MFPSNVIAHECIEDRTIVAYVTSNAVNIVNFTILLGSVSYALRDKIKLEQEIDILKNPKNLDFIIEYMFLLDFISIICKNNEGYPNLTNSTIHIHEIEYSVLRN